METPSCRKPTSGLLGGTADAPADAWVMLRARFRDWLSACRAVAELAFVQAPKRCIDPGPFRLPAALGGKRHGLDLHRIDPRKPSDSILIELHRRSVGGADAIFLVEFERRRSRRSRARS